jgi:protein O-mannosyl-transferase
MRLKILVCFALFILTLSVFEQTGDHKFIHFDDPLYITDNSIVREGITGKNIVWAFTTFAASNWHPLTWLSHMIDVDLFGLDPGMHHLVNVLLHGINTVILFLVLSALTGATRSSAFVAALFAVHPLHVESVAWVSERKDLLSTLFGFLMLWAYKRYAIRPRPGGYFVVVFFFALSLLSKPMWVTAPFLLLVLDFWPLQRLKVASHRTDSTCHPVPQLSMAHLAMEKVPLIVLSAVSSLIAVAAQNRGGSLYSLDRLGLGIRIENALVSYVRYLGKTFWPSGLAVYYPQVETGLPLWQIIGAVVLLLAITAVVLYHVRTMPWLSVGWFWFLGTLIPVIGIVQVGSQAMADRYTYFPIVGVFVAVAWGISRSALAAALNKVTFPVMALAILAILSAITFRQVGYWHDHESLFRHTIAVTKDNGRAHHLLSQGLASKGKYDEAVSHARESVRLDPNNPRSHKNLGYMLYRAGMLGDAIAEFEKAISLQPDYAEAHGNLAIAYGKRGWTDLAMKEMLLERRLKAAQPDP